jgi:glucan phosphoethanolaminetransferase (alkaline phosphatase superfamily)
MKTINKVALTLFIIGLVITIIFWIPVWGLNTGFGALFIGYPLIILSVIIFVIGWLISKFKSNTH